MLPGCKELLFLPLAVQEERQRSRERSENEAESTSGGSEDMPVERILEAELAVEPKTEAYSDVNTESSVRGALCSVSNVTQLGMTAFKMVTPPPPWAACATASLLFPRRDFSISVFHVFNYPT